MSIPIRVFILFEEIVIEESYNKPRLTYRLFVYMVFKIPHYALCKMRLFDYLLTNLLVKYLKPSAQNVAYKLLVLPPNLVEMKHCVFCA